MEIQFQQKVKVKSSSSSKMKARNNKFIGVRQRPSGRWVAEIKDTTQKIRMWLGTFESAEEAARAYDEAACLLRGSNTRTNFVTHVSSNSNSALASRIRGLLNSKRTKKQLESALPHNHHHSSTSTSTSTPSNTSTTTTTTPHHHHHHHHHDIDIDIDSRTPPVLSEDDVYKPDLSSCFEFDSSAGAWGFDLCEPAAAALELPKNAMELTEFERIKVERQISASLYAINGLHDYVETVYDPTESFWDLPPLCSLLT